MADHNEIEKLERMVFNLVDANYGAAYHHIGDGDGMHEFEANEIREWLNANGERVLRAVNAYTNDRLKAQVVETQSK